MENINAYILFGGIYLVLLFFDGLLKSCLHYPYIKFLEEFNIKINYLSVKWKTKAFNRTLIKWGNSRPKLLKCWFSFGSYCSVFLLPISVFILFYSIYQALFGATETTDGGKSAVIGIIIPGLNLPFSEVGYYSVTLFICSAIHELGHSLAAVLEDVAVIDIGCNLYFLLPIAYVNIATENFFSLSYKRKLNILCAGVWHNICLTFIFLGVYYSLPMVFSPLYSTGQGINVNDVVLRINDCEIKDENTWYNCLQREQLSKTSICIESDTIHSLDESIPLRHNAIGSIECCDPNNNRNLCFEYLDRGNGVLELPSYACLPARSVLETTKQFCTIEPHSCPKNLYCFRPLLGNNTHLFNIVCTNKQIIYLGSVNDIWATVDVSPYISKSNIFSVLIPDTVTKLSRYIVVISLGLAFVNILPITFMDGDYIITTLCLYILKKKLGRKASLLLSSLLKWFFTIILIVFLIYSVIKLY
ncbi:membrane-bound transcription factor site-2 protease isoform X2 [Cylas formicarius]|uniref:membrane-bound transcription factor site-2 protease isoform X2 n=1 Tax=Cylas formicarius TaxID=197179 RepID=UPI0029588346|nr:membrane-bound transcription factor site-2 protease isoform X2 [Cylas formicarius]